MRAVQLYPTTQDLKVTPEQQSAFDKWLGNELTDAIALRKRQEATWREILRQYEAIPRTPIRNTPIENAANIEIPLGAIATDSIYAQMIDLIYTLSQPITVRHLSKDYVQRAKAM